MSPAKIPEEPKAILTLEEASRLFQVSTKTFLKLLREEDIPARKIGREWRFSRNALLAWIAKGSSQSYSSADEASRAYFSELAPVYDEMRKDFYGDTLREMLIARFPPRPDFEVADIGAGTGYLAKSLAQKAKKVWAVDSSPAMLAVARKEFAGAGITNTEFCEGDALDLPLPDQSQNMVFANLLLHHISEPAFAINEMYRILKNGGQVIITDVKTHTYLWAKSEKSDLHLGFQALEIKKWLAEAGFTKIAVGDLGCSCRTSNQAGTIVEIPMFQANGFKPLKEKCEVRSAK
jgi:excisionase family DNA binding protein